MYVTCLGSGSNAAATTFATGTSEEDLTRYVRAAS